MTTEQIAAPAAPTDQDPAGTSPPVTVVIPTRGRPELVRLSVRGVVEQDYAGHVLLHRRARPGGA